MKLKSSNHHNLDEDRDDGFPDSSLEVSGLIPEPLEVTVDAVEESPAEPEPDRETSRLDVLLQLGLGAVLLGINSINKRLQEKQPQIVISSVEEEPLSHLDDDQDQLKYALIGMLLSTPRVVRRGTARAAQLTNAGVSRVSGLLRPVTGNRALRPVNHRLDQMVAKGERIVSDWIDTGRRGEKSSQVLLQQTTDEVVSELVDMLASRPEITELVQQQSMGMVDELTEELQGRAAATDTLLERIVFKLLPGEKRDTTPTLIIPVREEGEQVKDNKKKPKGRP